MKILFSHGMESGPWGTKIRLLAEIARMHEIEVDSLDYTDTMDPDVRVERLLATLADEDDDCLLAGSSMGGYVAAVASASAPCRGVFLMAPALHIPGYACQDYPTLAPHVAIVHGWNDEICPVENSIRYARKGGHTLHLVNGNHPLSDVLDELQSQFTVFLDRIA